MRLVLVSLVVIASVTVAAQGAPRAKITVWAAQTLTSAYGGLSYGGVARVHSC